MTAKIGLLLAAILFLIPSAPAQIVPGRYIVELRTEPTGGGKEGFAARRLSVRSEQSRARAALISRNITVLDSLQTVANALVVETSAEGAAEIRNIPGVVRVRPVRLYRRLLDRAVGLQQISAAWAQIGGSSNAGQGVKIGIIDTGIDASHPGFRDPTLQMPDGFPKVNREIDLSQTNNKVIVARNYQQRGSAKDVEGHGTAVAMIAAGVTNNSTSATITGVAPRAYLGNYKVFPDPESGAPTDYILRALEDAISDGMDVVNMSLGAFPAERPDEDPLVQAVNRAVQMGVIVIVAAGNSGSDMNTIGSPATAPGAITVGNSYTDRIFVSLITADGAAPMVAVPGSGRNSPLPLAGEVIDVTPLDGNGEACSGMPSGSLARKVALILRGTCNFSDKLENARRAGALAAVIYARPESPEPVTMDAGDSVLPSMMVAHSDGVILKSLAASSPTLTLDFSKKPLAVDSNRLNESSSKGPNVDSTVKPDLLAVGTSVFSAATDGGYSAASGTSFSAPMVAGAAALLKAARPGLSPQEYRTLLVNSATAFGNNLPVQHTGAGQLNLLAALRSTLAASPVSLSFGAGSGTVDQSRAVTFRNLGSAVDTYTITVAPRGDGAAPSVAVSSFELEPGASKTVELTLRGSALASKAHEGLLVVRGTQSEFETRIPYWYAVRSNTAEMISLIDPPLDGYANSGEQILFKVLDGSGLAMQAEPKVTVVSGVGAVTGVELESDSWPGVYAVNVRLGPGENVFQIDARGATKRFTLTGH